MIKLLFLLATFADLKFVLFIQQFDHKSTSESKSNYPRDKNVERKLLELKNSCLLINGMYTVVTVNNILQFCYL